MKCKMIRLLPKGRLLASLKPFYTFKLILFFLIVAFMNVNARGVSQTVTFSARNAPLQKIFEVVKEQTGFTVICNYNLIRDSKPVTVTANKMPLEDFIKTALKTQSLEYIIKNRTIVISRRKPDSFSDADLPGTPIPPVKITGKVTNENGEALAGVSIVIKGMEKGTTTNESGEFQMNVPDNVSVLVYSFVGYKTMEVKVGQSTSFNIKLISTESSLNQIVIIGYGQVNRKDLTGSVGQVDIKSLQKAPVTSFDQALAGRVAGVQVASTDGQPGAGVNIVIRGANSLTQDNSPLYVIDGFPIENYNNTALNPTEIESIDILKDASATAIYGARGANGVIIITTKRGKAGTPVVSYNGYYGIQQNLKEIPLLSPYEFVRLQLDMNKALATTTYLQNGTTLDSYKDVEPINWYDKVFRVAPIQTHNISVTGGTAKSRYSVSASVMDQKGIGVNSGFKRYQGRVTLDQNISDKLKLGVTANFSNVKTFGTIATTDNALPTSSFMYSIWSYRPVQTNPLVDIEDQLFDPTVPVNDFRVNPVIQAENELRQAISNNLFTNAYLEYQIVPNLKLRVTGGVNWTTGKTVTFNNTLTRTGSPFYTQSLGINGSQINSDNTNFANENTLTWSKVFNNSHNITVLAGYSQQTNKSSSMGAEAIQLLNESLGISGLDEGAPRTIYAGSSNWNLQSLFARAIYSYQSKYLLTATMRADGSSKFADGHRWGYFPSVGAAYKFSEENFMKDLHFLSNGKLRVGYGLTGNNRVGDFAYISTLSFANAYSYSIGNASPPLRGAVAATLGNPLLKWETTKQSDVGIDLGLFNNRISLTADYYYKKTENLLLNAQIPSVTGYSTAFKNIGKVANSGIELELNTDNISGKRFRWNTSFNIAFNKSKVLALNENQESIASPVASVFGGTSLYIAKVGKPIAQFYGVFFDGLYQYPDFNKQANGTYVLKDNVHTNGNPRAAIQPGDNKFRDLNNDGLVDAKDFTVIGNPNPDFIGGFTNNFEYGNFDLSIFFQFMYGYDVLNSNKVLFEGQYNFVVNTNQYATYANRWSPTNTNTDITPRLGAAGPRYPNTRLIEDASFLRLKTVSLGYNLPERILRTVKMKSARVYVSSQNLYTWTSYSGMDPEVSTRHTNLTPGYDYSPYPRANTIIAGVNITL